jgi:hypothetical protein
LSEDAVALLCLLHNHRTFSGLTRQASRTPKTTFRMRLTRKKVCQPIGLRLSITRKASCGCMLKSSPRHPVLSSPSTTPLRGSLGALGLERTQAPKVFCGLQWRSTSPAQLCMTQWLTCVQLSTPPTALVVSKCATRHGLGTQRGRTSPAMLWFSRAGGFRSRSKPSSCFGRSYEMISRWQT